MGNCCTNTANPNFFKRTRNIRCLTTPDSPPPSSSPSYSSSVSCPVSPASVLKEPHPVPLLHRCTLGRELGRGEFGVTRVCIDNDTAEHFACKSISKKKLRTAIDVEDVRREVEIMRGLPPHPNIVSLRDAYEDAGAVHLVMELCQGGELFDRIVARGHYTERAAAVVFRTIAEVVKHCHEHGVIHRDLKPENFLFANAEETSPLKAIDFGLSVCFKPGERFKEIVGSPYYMAPEVLKRNYGPEADVWSAGVILYILLCGVPPFWAETDKGIAQAIISSVIDFTREPWPKVSQNAKDLVRSMLDPNPSSRLTSQEVLDHPWLKNIDTAPDISLGEDVRARLKQFSLMNRFKKRALKLVAENLPVEEVAGIKQIFDLMDTDKNGNLTIEELREGFQVIGKPEWDSDVEMLMEAADIDGNGTLDCEEFMTVSVHLKKISSEDHLLSKVFSYFDKNESGFIEIDDLREALQEKETGLSEQLIQDIILDVDKDKDGRISYDEFALMMNSGSDWRNSSRQYSKAVLNTLSNRLFRIGSTD